MKKILFLLSLLFLLSGTLFWQIRQLPSSPASTATKTIPPVHFPFFKRKAVTLIAVGDVMLGRMVNVQMLKYQDFKYPFLKTASTIAAADITFGNLESPIIDNCPTTSVGMIFCSREEAIEGLKFAGFDVLSIANNHILNHGPEGLSQTTALLNKNGILPSSNQLTSYLANKLTFGFLSFDLVTYPKAAVVEEVKKNANKVDVLVVSLHWGGEYQKEPLPWQKDLAHQIIDSGAKVIIGHHPHVTQPTEKYQSGLIFYSLGNFIFDQPWSEKTKKGKIAKVVFEGKNIKSYEEIAIYIADYSQPQFSQ
ncbi:MAG TPA: CapA family protein [Patescibacteria group bacterium]|nr:CapA family protein [Patescibacteria group bacterium]